MVIPLGMPLAKAKALSFSTLSAVWGPIYQHVNGHAEDHVAVHFRRLRAAVAPLRPNQILGGIVLERGQGMSPLCQFNFMRVVPPERVEGIARKRITQIGFAR